MEYATRISFRGRTLGGYANWSLNGGNRIRLNLNTIWADDLEAVLDYMGRKHPNAAPGSVVRTAQNLFAMEFGRICGHEILHLVLHQEPDVRRFLGDRFREQDTHHDLMRRMGAY